jgi:acyl carrier protein
MTADKLSVQMQRRRAYWRRLFAECERSGDSVRRFAGSARWRRICFTAGGACWKGKLAPDAQRRPEEVTLELSAGSIESWDSFGHLQAILALEQEFGARFAPEQIPKLITVALLQRALWEQGVLTADASPGAP